MAPDRTNVSTPSQQGQAQTQTQQDEHDQLRQPPDAALHAAGAAANWADESFMEVDEVSSPPRKHLRPPVVSTPLARSPASRLNPAR
jgi:hypothetical protein